MDPLLERYNSDLDKVITNQFDLHAKMQRMTNFYKSSAFYRTHPKEARDASANYMKILADKNIHYTSEVPEVKIIADPADRENANVREKILYGTYRACGMPLLQRKWARDGTLRSMAVAVTSYDFKQRIMRVERVDPRHCYWSYTNLDNNRIGVFYVVYPISRAEANEKFKVDPTADNRAALQFAETDHLSKINGEDWFTYVKRMDGETTAVWIGNKWVQKPQAHNLGDVPVDLFVPLPGEEAGSPGDFYLEPLVAPQAKLNDLEYRAQLIVRRNSNPIFWGRGIQARGFDDVKAAVESADAGMVGLNRDGEIGVVQLTGIELLDKRIEAVKNDMQRLAGYGAASFGENVGANTSGDALGMYFMPTEKHVQDQTLSLAAFYESINAKILRGYEHYGRGSKKFTLTAFAPRSTVQASNGESRTVPVARFEQLVFDASVIDGRYVSKAIPKPVTPKNELEEKRLVVEAVNNKFLSRYTGYEIFGIESPEDERRRLEEEQLDPALNPDNVNTLLQGGANAAQPSIPALPPAPATVRA